MAQLAGFHSVMFVPVVPLVWLFCDVMHFATLSYKSVVEFSTFEVSGMEVMKVIKLILAMNIDIQTV